MIPPRRLRNLAILSTFGLLPLQTDALPDNSHSLQDHSNGLRSLALSRPARANALIGLQFKAGSFQDTVPGLAHLAEHVFLRQHIVDARGERLALRDFLTLHGGRVSAKTSHESTYFVFEIQREAASLLLQELAELLRTTRVTTSIIASEISAVSDEFSFLKTRENWLLQDALKSATAAGHPFRRNSAGNQASFAPYSLDALKAELKSFLSVTTALPTSVWSISARKAQPNNSRIYAKALAPCRYYPQQTPESPPCSTAAHCRSICTFRRPYLHASSIYCCHLPASPGRKGKPPSTICAFGPIPTAQGAGVGSC